METKFIIKEDKRETYCQVIKDNNEMSSIRESRLKAMLKVLELSGSKYYKPFTKFINNMLLNSYYSDLIQNSNDISILKKYNIKLKTEI